MIKKGCLFLFLVVIVMIAIPFLHHKKEVQGDSFVKIPIRFVPLLNTPIMNVEISRRKYSLNIDLGTSHNVILDKKVLDKIELKESLENLLWFDLKGNEYHSPQFRIPKIQIGEKSQILEAVASEESIDFIAHGSQVLPDYFFLHKGISALYSTFVDGRIGWSVFQRNVCLFDFPSSEFLIAKDMLSLTRNAGYSLEDFAHTPFEIQDCGVILSIKTDFGEKKFLLDTGSTWSLIHGPSIEREKGQFATNTFIVGGVDLGKHKFRIDSFSDQFSFDGILGVDFFRSHSICLDFHNHIAYIKRQESAIEKFLSWIKK